MNRRDTLSLLFGLYSLSPPGREPDLRTRCVNHGTFSKDLKFFISERAVVLPRRNGGSIHKAVHSWP